MEGRDDGVTLVIGGGSEVGHVVDVGLGVDVLVHHEVVVVVIVLADGGIRAVIVK